MKRILPRRSDMSFQNKVVRPRLFRVEPHFRFSGHRSSPAFGLSAKQAVPVRIMGGIARELHGALNRPHTLRRELLLKVL
jgi:hypothetical protein